MNPVKHSSAKNFVELRKRARAFLADQSDDIAAISQESVMALVHELETYQIELELQNEDLRSAQAELEKSRQRYSNLYDFAPIGYITISDKGLIIEVNLTGADMFGIPRAKLLKQPFSYFIFESDQDIFYCSKKKLLEDGGTNTCELRLRKQDGTLAYVQMESVVSPQIDGQASQYLITLTDISTHKKIEAELQQVKERYRSIVMDQNDLICRFDPHGKITFVNDAYCRCFGVRYQDILGTNFLPNIHKDDLVLVNNHFKDLTRLNPDKTISHRVCLPNGEVRWQQWCGRAFFDKDGSLLECQAVGRDITEQEEHKAALKEAHDQLERRVQERTLELQMLHTQLTHTAKLSAVGVLSASIAHEINNPMSGIMSVLQGLKKRAKVNNEDGELLDMAIGECHRVKGLIKSLNDFNKPSSGKMALVNVHATIDSILTLCAFEYEKHSIQVKTQYAVNLPLIEAVGDQIKQVFLNLLSNAIDACKKGGTIHIKTEAVKEHVYVSVQDNGKGIKPENMDYLFMPFFTTKPEVRGVGLGLPISYGIIKGHGGRIEVQSKEGKGSTFTVILPIKGTRVKDKKFPIDNKEIVHALVQKHLEMSRIYQHPKNNSIDKNPTGPSKIVSK